MKLLLGLVTVLGLAMLLGCAAQTSTATTQLPVTDLPPIIVMTTTPIPPTRTPAATPMVGSNIRIDPPSVSKLSRGNGIDVTGTVNGTAVGEVILVQLYHDGSALTDDRVLAQDGEWRVLTLLPDAYTGRVEIVASLIGRSGDIVTQTSRSLHLTSSTASQDRDDTLSKP